MPNFTVEEIFSTELAKMETTDPVHADTVNPKYQLLLNNTAFLNRVIKNMQGVDDSQTSTTEPTSPVEGQLWYNPDTKELKIYLNSAWIDVTTETSISDTAPTSPKEGQKWYDIANKRYKIYQDGAWREILTFQQMGEETSAGNIGMTPITTVDGVANDIQTFLEELVNRLTSTSVGDSGASLIGVESIAGISGSTVQAILENLKDSIRTDEEIQDVVGTFIAGGTNVTATYDDVANTLTLSATDTQLTTTEVQTAVNNDADHGSTAPHNYTTTASVTSTNWGDYEIQKDGVDGTGIINFKTV